MAYSVFVQSAHSTVQAPERLSIRQCAFYCEQNKSLFNARCLIEYRVNRLVNKCKATVHFGYAQSLQHQMTMFYFTKTLFIHILSGNKCLYFVEYVCPFFNIGVQTMQTKQNRKS